MTVKELLQASLVAHKRAKPTGKGLPRPDNWLDLLREAATLRKQALALDPDMTDPEWGATSHKNMTAFYQDVVPDA